MIYYRDYQRYIHFNHTYVVDDFGNLIPVIGPFAYGIDECRWFNKSYH